MSNNTKYKKFKKYKKNYDNKYPKQKTNEINNSQTNTHEFSSYASRRAYSNYYFGINIFDLYSKEQLADLVKDPMGNNKILREISQVLYSTNGTYTNTVDYITAMPTLDKVIVTYGKHKNKKHKNKELMESVLRSIKDREFIRDALWNGMIDGIAYYYFEITNRPSLFKRFMTDYDVDSIYEINELGINVGIISLPTDYTRIVGIKNNSYVLSFNLDYFTDMVGETTENKLKKFPKEIREAYQVRKTDNGFTGGNWVVLDNKKTIVHKIRSGRREPYGRPIVLAAISDILYSDYFTATKRNILDEINNKIIYQTLPEGQNKGTCALTKAQQEKQHETVKGAVMRKNSRGATSFVTVSAGTKLNTLDVGNTDIFDEKYEANLGDKIALDMGMAGALLNGVGSGSYAAQTQNLELITAQIFQWVDQITNELNKCIAQNIICDTRNRVEIKYLPMTFVNKDTMVGYMKDLYLQGKGSLTAWASACGLSADIFYALLDQELEDDIENKYPVHKTSYTLSANNEFALQDKGGRPTASNPSDRTIQSRENNGNNIPSPSDNK
jgi:hypothetical protein